MIIPSQAVKIVVATKPVDFRKGHDGMAAVVQNELGLDPYSGIIVVFREDFICPAASLLEGQAGRPDQGAAVGR